MTTVSPALPPLPGLPVGSAGGGPSSDAAKPEPNTFRSALDAELDARSSRSASPAPASATARPATARPAQLRPDAVGGHRPKALRVRSDDTAGDSSDSGSPATAGGPAAAASTAATGASDPSAATPTAAATPTDPNATPDAATLAVLTAGLVGTPPAPPPDPRLIGAVRGRTVKVDDAAGSAVGDASKQPGPAGSSGTAGPGVRTLPTAGPITAGPITAGPMTASPAPRHAESAAVPTAASVPPAPPVANAPAARTDGAPAAALPAPGVPVPGVPGPVQPVDQPAPVTATAGISDSPATATSITEALAQDAAKTAPASDGSAATTPAPTGSTDPAVAQPVPGQASSAMPNGSGTQGGDSSTTSSRPAPVTPASITAATAGKVAETAATVATDSLLAAAGAGVRTLPDLPSTGAAPAAGTTAAALPSHVAELTRLARISADGTARLTVRLDPPELGAVTLHLTSRGSDVELSLRAETAAGATALAGQQSGVRQLLSAHGFDLSRFTVTGVPGAESSAAFGDPRQRDQAGGFSADGRQLGNGFSTDPGADRRGESRAGSTSADGRDEGRSGSRRGSDRSDGRTGAAASPQRRSSGTASEGTWL